MQNHHQVSGLITVGDCLIPNPPISVGGVGVAQMSFSEFERKQSLQFDASIWSFHAAQIKTYTMFLHLRYVVQGSGWQSP